jgi:endonuclease/exonuclease/phosphatase family metal-dependent hydrolase
MPLKRLVVATLNIWNKSGPWQERLALIRSGISSLRPDVLGLQEVLRLVPEDGAVYQPTPLTCQGHEIAEGLGYSVTYGAASDWSQGLKFGNAVLTRHPVVEHENFVLPGAESGETRAVLYALLQTPHGRLPVFVTHLNWKLQHGSVRFAQVRALVELVFRLAPVQPFESSVLPPVLMGDFNAEPEADEIRYLCGYTGSLGKTVYFADAWIYGGDGTPGSTFDRRNCFAALAHEPPRRIDYIFVRGPDRAFRGEPLATHLAFATPLVHPEGEIWPSDHFGVVTELAAEARSS